MKTRVYVVAWQCRESYGGCDWFRSWVACRTRFDKLVAENEESGFGEEIMEFEYAVDEDLSDDEITDEIDEYIWAENPFFVSREA